MDRQSIASGDWQPAGGELLRGSARCPFVRMVSFLPIGHPGPNGYRLEVRCHCGVVFERWVTPTDDVVELALFARGN